MKLITRETDYAIRALCYIAKQKEEVISVTQLVKKLKVPKPFLRKILQILNTNGILESYKGLGGGFKLLRSPNKIFIVDLIGIFQGPFKFKECIFKKNICLDIRTCLLKQKLDRIEKQVISELKSISISYLLN